MYGEPEFSDCFMRGDTKFVEAFVASGFPFHCPVPAIVQALKISTTCLNEFF